MRQHYEFLFLSNDIEIYLVICIAAFPSNIETSKIIFYVHIGRVWTRDTHIGGVFIAILSSVYIGALRVELEASHIGLILFLENFANFQVQMLNGNSRGVGT